MDYNFRDIEKKWQQWWNEKEIYKVSNQSTKPKFYVLDMFPYPSGAGLHVGHPLGYIASDIYARYKRLKGFNVLHPMGYDAFGLPAEQYAIEHGIHPAISTKQNIENFRKQLDKIGFCFDWSRQVNTSEPSYYKWTQWIFLQLFKSFYNRTTKKAESIESLVDVFQQEGNTNHPIPNSQFQIQSTVNGQPSTGNTFTADDWNSFDEKQQQSILMEYRLAYCGYGEVNWCEALGTVLANDEVINGVSERGGYPVTKKKLRQWYLRITEYADRLLEGLQTVDFSEAMKEMQTNWIGKSYGAEIDFRLIPNPFPSGEGSNESGHFFKTADSYYWKILKEYGRENRKNQTEAENILWQHVRNNQLNSKVRRQHAIEGFIVDFAFLREYLVIEIDGDYHNEDEQKNYDDARTEYLKEFGFLLLRFSNEEVINQTEQVIKKIQSTLHTQSQVSFLQKEKGLRDEASLKVFTTRPDTIFGVDFMVIAPEHELVETITTQVQKEEVEQYITWVKSRSDRERQAEKTISGVLTGAYAINPFNRKEIPIYISEYVLAGYGTGAIMAVPCGDERDFKFAKHFNINITNIIGDKFNGEEANPTKDALLENSDFLNGMIMRDAINIVSNKLEALGIGKKKVNYKMRDAAFSRQRYWGEPFPIVWKDGIAYPLDENELPLELPYIKDIKAGKDGEGPLANMKEWSTLIPSPSPSMEKGASAQRISDEETTGVKTFGVVPKYAVYTPMQYELAKGMRKNYTEAEDLLWQQLRGDKLDVKFRRQHPIDAYIVDFISLHEKLIIEVDGGYHENEDQKKYDENRTQVLKEIGFKIIRFTNDEVISNIKEVLKQIKQQLQKNKLHQKEVGSAQTPLSIYGEGLGVRETNTMPGYAGSSWYFLRYMDPHNNDIFCDKKISDYWNQVDVYVGGTEHAVGHLLYSRMWTKFLYDLNLIGFDEPYKKLLNQGMIQGSSRFMYFVSLLSLYNENVKDFSLPKIYISKTLLDKYETEETQNFIIEKIHEEALKQKILIPLDLSIRLLISPILPIRVDVNLVEGVHLNIKSVQQSKTEYKNAWFLFDGDSFVCGAETEKMSKSKFNTVDPSDLVEKYGADTFRMYEMFLGPVEQSKPWDTKGIEGVHRFLRKLWRLFYDDSSSLSGRRGIEGEAIWNDEKATDTEFKILHKAIKKIEEDTERFSYNTAVSAFMVCVNELADIKCSKKEILEPLVIMLSSYAPHIAEELYQALSTSVEGAKHSVLDATYPSFDSKYLVESTKEYPISINGKLRTTLKIALDVQQKEIEEMVLQNDVVQKWLDGKSPQKIIFVKGKMINVVI